jgi:hypothetical protein
VVQRQRDPEDRGRQTGFHYESLLHQRGEIAPVGFLPRWREPRCVPEHDIERCRVGLRAAAELGIVDFEPGRLADPSRNHAQRARGDLRASLHRLGNVVGEERPERFHHSTVEIE